MVEGLKLTVLVDNSTSIDNPDLLGKHGLSLLVEAALEDDRVNIIVDTGPSPDVIRNNLKVLNIDMSRIDCIIITHGHYDHSGGLIEVLKQIGKRTMVLAHPKAFEPKFAFKPKLRFVGIPFKLSSIEEAGGIVVSACNSITIAKGVMTSGEIERMVDYERVEDLWVVEDHKFQRDSISEEQAVIIDVKDKGLVVVSGCAHSGIINTLMHAQRLTGVNHIYAVIGGLHLVKADDKRIMSTLNDLLKINPEFIGPCHCTGDRAIRILSESFGGRCKQLKVGDVINL